MHGKCPPFFIPLVQLIPLFAPGRLSYRNGSTYEGELRANEFDGFGVYRDVPNHNVYEGLWQGGKMHGEGVHAAPRHLRKLYTAAASSTLQ